MTALDRRETDIMVGLSNTEADIAAGRLIALLTDADPGDTEPFHALWLKSIGPLPFRVRLVLDHLAENGRVNQFH